MQKSPKKFEWLTCPRFWVAKRMSAPRYPSRVEHHLFELTVERLLTMLQEKQLTVPEHQRAYCWNKKKEQRLINTILLGLPMPAVIVREHSRVDGPKSLEDGNQRLTCLRKFRADQIAFKTDEDTFKKYSELSEREKFYFDEYRIPVISYSNATDAQATTCFDNFQNGTALSVGERLHSLAGLSEVVTFARNTLLTKNKYHDRGVPIWGTHLGIGHRGKDLTNAVALVVGLAFSSPNHVVVTQKYDEVREHIDKEMSPVLKAKVLMNLERIFDIYEGVEKRSALLNYNEVNYQWNPGSFTGYIIYSLISHPTHADFVVARWIDYMTDLRKQRAKLTTFRGASAMKHVLSQTLHAAKTGARSWNNERWRTGSAVVFAGTHLEPFYTTPVEVAEAASVDDEESDDESEDSDY